MQIYTQPNTPFSGSLYVNKSYMQTAAYAKQTGQSDILKAIKETIKNLPERNLRIVHRYCKKDSLVKTQVFFNKYCYKDVYLCTSTKTNNPSELTFSLLKDLLNPESMIYKKIYQ